MLHVIARVVITATAQSHLAKFVLGHRSNIELFVFETAVLLESRSDTTKRQFVIREAWNELETA